MAAILTTRTFFSPSVHCLHITLHASALIFYYIFYDFLVLNYLLGQTLGTRRGCFIALTLAPCRPIKHAHMWSSSFQPHMHIAVHTQMDTDHDRGEKRQDTAAIPFMQPINAANATGAGKCVHKTTVVVICSCTQWWVETHIHSVEIHIVNTCMV